MLASLLLILALVTTGVDASPSPQASAAPQQTLKEIGHVFSSGACTTIVVRANSAISSTLRNDQTVSMAIDTLRHVDLDSRNVIQKRKGMASIEQLANDLRHTSVDASAQIKKLRDLAAQTTDPVRKQDLKEFANALDGAVARQKRIGTDLGRMLAVIEGRDARAEAQGDIMNANPYGIRPGAFFDSNFAPTHYNEMAAAAASEVENRTLSIAADESKAAEHVVGAVNGC
jgi:hypothetical protein